jgi:hypothetical protein
LIADLCVPHLDQGCGAGDVEAGAPIREPVVAQRAFKHKRYKKSFIGGADRHSRAVQRNEEKDKYNEHFGLWSDRYDIQIQIDITTKTASRTV